MAEVARGYSTLEYSVDTCSRGSRKEHAAQLIRSLTGAEDALVVNNNAAAVLLVLATHAAGKEVIVSRGELVEIGGSFRIPDVMAASGAKLVEVGATNRTHLVDYERAITPETAMILKVHPSNYRIEGFHEEVGSRELAALAHKHGLLFYEDQGSGALLPDDILVRGGEETTPASVSAGLDLVSCSGDKLLGAAQAGIIMWVTSAYARPAPGQTGPVGARGHAAYLHGWRRCCPSRYSGAQHAHASAGSSGASCPQAPRSHGRRAR